MRCAGRVVGTIRPLAVAALLSAWPAGAGAIQVVDTSGALLPRFFHVSTPERHSVRGIVTAFGDSSLTIVRTTRHHEKLTFTITEASVRQGTITVGALVSVRYCVERDAMVATAVSVHGRQS